MLVYLARETGQFAAANCDVLLEEFPGSGRAMEALLGGSVDVVSGYHEQVFGLPDGAPDVLSFLAMTNGHLVALAATASSGIKTVGDLRGKPVGVTTLGSGTHLWLNFALGRSGIAKNDVSPVAIGTAGRAVAALEQGAVPAAVVSDFTVRTLEKRRGSLVLLADVRTPAGAKEFYGVDQYPGAVLFARRDWIEAHRGQARQLVRAIGKTRDWVRSRSVEEVASRLPASHKGEDPALYTEVIRSTISMLSPDGLIGKEGAEAARKLANSSRPPESSYRNDFVAPVQ